MARHECNPKMNSCQTDTQKKKIYVYEAYKYSFMDTFILDKTKIVPNDAQT